MNMIDDGHPAIFDIVEDIYRPILGRKATEDEVNWFLNEGIYKKVA
jgi:hypothetical protein